jgi:hypothetical protein
MFSLYFFWKWDAPSILFMPMQISCGQDKFGVPLKFRWDIVPWFVTPCGIWSQHDQTNPFSYHMEGGKV